MCQPTHGLRRIRLLQIALLIYLNLSCCAALRCRTDDGPSEAELKRIARSCMRKISENSHNSGSGHSTSLSTTSNAFGNYGGQQQPQQQQSRFNYGAPYGSASYDYDDEDGNSNNNNNNNLFGNYARGEQDILRQRNHERQQTSSRAEQKAHNERGRYEHGNNGAGGGASSSAGGRNGHNGGNNNANSNSKHHNNNNNNNGNNGNNNNNGNSNSNGNNNSNNSSSYDTACVVHCFFEEMHMLNNDDYPDRYKAQYLLTRELRDRELRNFYIDTIQQCFQYMESQRRRDKCHYSRELVNCMSEYAKANCDDWQQYSIIFN